ncbi:MAG: hypothetical protein RLZZ244_816 [Verrucomicrobiota bacterium]|jgi:hypothetical protein
MKAFVSPLTRILCVAVALALFVPGGWRTASAEEFPPVRAAVECTARKGLPHFFAKVARGGEIKVAYLGGSITAQPGYRVKTLAHFASAYPQAKFSEINAAIGGTGSGLGVFRIEHDVLAASPDLLLVEFAVNDGGTSPEEIVRAMEGIVRKTWQRLPECDVLFVYTFTDKMVEELQGGKFNRSAATMEVVADHYGIPTIHMGLEAVRLEKEGKLRMKAPEAKVERVSGDELNKTSPIAVDADGKIPFSLDGVHPYVDTGHRLYTEAVVRSLSLLRAPSEGASPRQIPAPLNAKNYEKTAMLPLDKAAMRGEWTRLPADQGLGKQFGKRVDALWRGAPGAELSFKFRGTTARMYDLVGPDCGKLEVTVDGKTKTFPRFDAYCTYHRLATSTLIEGGEEGAVHEVTVRVLSDALEKRSVLFEKNRADLDKNPAKYEGTFWYSGALFLVGELVP